jgi:hypothetical protein
LIEPNSNNPVRVTAEQRSHPALRKLARACIALALIQLASKSSAESVPPAEPAAESAATPGQEQAHA